SHPELLDEMAKAFAASKFDVPFMIRAITATRAYQRSSAVTEPGQRERRLFARMAVKGPSGEQPFDSLAGAAGHPGAAARPNQAPDGGGERALFLDRFALPGKKTDPQTSILQALSLMNGRFTGDATSVERSETLAAVATLPQMSPAERVEALYVAALSRKPS